MVDLWKSIPYNAKFSGFAFLISGFLGLASIGFLGVGLYYVTFFLFLSYPTLNDWHGDWVWPAVILAGICWSFGFIIAGIVWHFLSRKISSKIRLKIIYGFILWLWAAFVWYLIIAQNLEKM